MDLRVKRTKKNIYNAFIELRTKKPLEKITIKELAELADINKATFYSYYSDIYDLSDKIENEIIDDVLKSLTHPEEIFVNPRQITRELTVSMTAIRPLLGSIFSGSRSGLLVKKLDYALKEQTYKYHPEYKNNLEFDVILTILIQGGFIASVSYSENDTEKVTEIISRISEYVRDSFLPNNKSSDIT